MKNRIALLFLSILIVQCGGESANPEETLKNTVYADDHEWIVAASELKQKLGVLQQEFTAIANKELEETVCPEGASVPYSGNKGQMNVWLMMNYMLDNFDQEKFGQYDFQIPADKMKRDVPLTELNWINFNNNSDIDFSLYRNFPDLKNVPLEKADTTGAMQPYEKPLRDMSSVLIAMKDGMFGVVPVLDYFPPAFTDQTHFETGYIMGYVLLADWESGKLSCMAPVLAENDPDARFENLAAMKADLQTQTFIVIKEIVRNMTGFGGTIEMNNVSQLDVHR